jgi:TonB family protein
MTPLSTSRRDHVGVFSTSSLQQKTLWADLYENLHDAFFLPKLPPLELTSTPVPVPDRLAVKTNPWAVGTATIVNGSILALLFLLAIKGGVNRFPHPVPGSHIDLSDLGIFAPSKAQAASHGGGGGGDNALIDPIQGRPPKFENTPLAPPTVSLIEHPKLALDSAVAAPPDIHLPDDPTLPTIGVQHSANHAILSNGPGTRGSIGTNSGGGDGPGIGTGEGPGYDHGIGGGKPYAAGSPGVISPVPIVAPEAEFSDEARHNKYQGVCMISLVVDTHGNPQNPRVIRALGMGLDEKAIDAVRHYRFKPGMMNGKPVPVVVTIAVNFRLF